MDNPFKIIKPTEKPPEHLKKDVLESVELMMIILRLMQLFMIDFSMSIPESLQSIFRTTTQDKDKLSGSGKNDLTNK